MRGVLLSLVCAAGLLAATPAKSIASLAPAHAAMSAPAAPAFGLSEVIAGGLISGADVIVKVTALEVTP